MPYSSISPTFFFKLFALGPAKKLAFKLRHVENINQIVYVFEIRKQLIKTSSLMYCTVYIQYTSKVQYIMIEN
jgi:hypothetical protein